MIYSTKLLSFLKKKKINFFSGVPDSTLKNLTELIEKEKTIAHYPVYNEGSAVSLGIGYHLSTNKIPCIYLQNSGLSNAINPLLSIAHQKVYAIPVVLIIGWRGSPFSKKDEPQHNLKGKITRNILKLLNIRHLVLRKDRDLKKLGKLIDFGKQNNQTVACLIEKNILVAKQHFSSSKTNLKSDITREFFIIKLLKIIDKKTRIVSTTGYTSREVYRIRKNYNLNNGKDFYMVGGMGHSSMVALGASFKKKRNVLCLDGDGSILMHFGSLKVSGLFGKNNFKHIVFNNASHESVGGQRTYVENLKFTKIAKLFGYKHVDLIKKKSELNNKLKKFLSSKGPSFLEVKIKQGTLKNLGRPNNFI